MRSDWALHNHLTETCSRFAARASALAICSSYGRRYVVNYMILDPVPFQFHENPFFFTTMAIFKSVFSLISMTFRDACCFGSVSSICSSSASSSLPLSSWAILVSLQPSSHTPGLKHHRSTCLLPDLVPGPETGPRQTFPNLRTIFYTRKVPSANVILPAMPFCNDGLLGKIFPDRFAFRLFPFPQADR